MTFCCFSCFQPTSMAALSSLALARWVGATRCFIGKNNLKLKSNGLYLRPSMSSHDPVFVMKFEFAEKTRSCFALATEHQYWTVTVQSLCRVKKILMTSNVLPLHFAPSQASSSQNSNVENFCRIVTILLKSLGLYLLVYLEF
jgi:hypothetical protein